MVEWLTVISLVVVGIVLIVLEIIFVPGTTLVGILGFACLAGGVYVGFTYFDNSTAWTILVSSAVLSVGALVLAFRSKAWDKLALKDTNKAKYNEGMTNELKPGLKGITTSVLRPIGKAEIENREYEVKTLGNYLDEGSPIRIIRIEGNNIYVEPIK